MKHRNKNLWSILLALTLMLSLVPAFSMTALAADNVSTYTLQIPSTLTVSAAGWNETSGLTAAVTSGDTFDSGKKLTVTATSTNSWSLVSGSNSVGYNLATATGAYSSTATPASWEFSATELNASGGTTKTMGIIVEDYSSKPAGTYQDTVTFTASVEDARQLYSFTLTGPYSHQSLVVEFYEGDKWSDMVEKYSLITATPTVNWVGFSTDGFIYKGSNKVLTTDTVDPNATYTIQ